MSDVAQAASAATSDAPKWSSVVMNKQARLYKALSAAQSKMRNASKDKRNNFANYNYASFASICDAVRGPFGEEGLFHYAQTDVSFDDRTKCYVVKVVTVLAHVDGGEISTGPCVYVQDRAGANAGGAPLPSLSEQSFGKANTYLRKYGLMSLAGLASDDDEDADKHVGADNVTQFRRPLPSPEDQARVLADTAKIKKATTMVELDALAEGFKATYAEHPGKEEVGAAWIKRKNEITSTPKGA
jgi:hypothetical protein